MSRILAITFMVFALLVHPTSAYAAPSAVRGVDAERVGDDIVVTWDALEEDDVASYRVYFSSESILQNGGVYDDFEEAGPVTSHTLRFKPKSSKLYIGILAVNSADEESEFFTEETSVVLKVDTVNLVVDDSIIPSPREQRGPPVLNVSERSDQRERGPELPLNDPIRAPAWQPSQESTTLRLLLVDVLSSSQLELTFSDVPQITPAFAPQAFRVVDQFDQPLPITSIVLDQKRIVVNTIPQRPGFTYKIDLSEPLVGAGGQKLDPIDRQSYFRGFESGVNQPADTQLFAPENTNQTIPPALPVQGLRLRAQQTGKGEHTIVAAWEVNPLSLATSYVVRQSLDNGRTFSEPQVLPTDIAGIEIPGVTSADYGLEIRSLGLDGRQSQPAFESVHLPGGIEAPPTYSPPPSGRPTPPPRVAPPVLPPPPAVPPPQYIDSQLSTLQTLPPFTQVPLPPLPSRPPVLPAQTLTRALPRPPLNSNLAQTGAGWLVGVTTLSGTVTYLRNRRRKKHSPLPKNSNAQ